MRRTDDREARRTMIFKSIRAYTMSTISWSDRERVEARRIIIERACGGDGWNRGGVQGGLGCSLVNRCTRVLTEERLSADGREWVSGSRNAREWGRCWRLFERRGAARRLGTLPATASAGRAGPVRGRNLPSGNFSCPHVIDTYNGGETPECE